MTETAKKCLTWGIVLMIVGSAIDYLPSLLAAHMTVLYGTPGYLAYSVLMSVTMLIRTAAVAVGAALIGAAIVINVLSPKPSAAENSTDDESDQGPF